jgi:hypothetical protein
MNVLQLYALFLRSQISSLLGQSSAVRNPTFHNLLLSAFPQLINEAPLRNALIAQFSQLGGNVKANLVAFADPQNRDVVNQIKFLHRAVSLLQVRFLRIQMLFYDILLPICLPYISLAAFVACKWIDLGCCSVA